MGTSSIKLVCRFCPKKGSGSYWWGAGNLQIGASSGMTTLVYQANLVFIELARCNVHSQLKLLQASFTHGRFLSPGACALPVDPFGVVDDVRGDRVCREELNEADVVEPF